LPKQDKKKTNAKQKRSDSMKQDSKDEEEIDQKPKKVPGGKKPKKVKPIP
jgi:hypothetical protein